MKIEMKPVARIFNKWETKLVPEFNARLKLRIRVLFGVSKGFIYRDFQYVVKRPIVRA